MLSENIAPATHSGSFNRALPGRSLSESFVDRWPRSRTRSSFWHEVAYYAGSVFLSAAILTCLLRLWDVDLAVPFSYGGDGVFTQMWVQGLIENGWYLHHPRLGAPAELDLATFPMADGMHFAVLKLITQWVPRPGAACNLYYLLTYPLTTLFALFVLRRLRAARAAALVCSLLFTFLPYHYLRGTGHLFLAAYYHVPLLALLALRIYQAKSPFVSGAHGAAPSRWTWRSWPALGALLVCVLAGSGGVYYAFFACFFLLVAGACACWRTGRLEPLSSSTLLVVVISLTVLANVWPFLIDRWQHVANECAVQRLPANAESYGLKISQLLLPVTGHRLPSWRALKERYNDPATPLVNENDSATLGCVAGVGFLLLIIGLLARSRGDARSDDLRHGLGVLNLSAVLLATIGGFSSLASFLLTPWIRGYNRVSVFIAFFALAMVALVLSRLQARWATTGRRQALFHVALAVLLGLGLCDQTNKGFVHVQQDATRRAFAEDAAFIARIESEVPEGCMIFELPYLPFPEFPPPRPMADYDPFRPYLHSTKLRWSFAAVKGTYADVWQQAIVGKPMQEMVETLALAGFGGIYVDRFGYADRAEELQCALLDVTGQSPLCSSSGRFAFYDLGPLGAKLRQTCSAAQWQRRRQEALAPLLVTWPRGSELRETGPPPAGKCWRWSNDNATCLVHNRMNQARLASLEMVLESSGPRSCKLRLDGPLIQEELTIASAPMRFVATLVVPPGEHAIHFHCNEHPALRSKDLRLVDITENSEPEAVRAHSKSSTHLRAGP